MRRQVGVGSCLLLMFLLQRQMLHAVIVADATPCAV
jgi:hypothetical protein